MQVLKETTAYRAALRTRILEQAMKDFSQRGIRAVKMDDIASELSISKRTVYEIFQDKETLLFEGIKDYDVKNQNYLRQYAEEGHHVLDIIMEAYRQKVKEVRSVNPQFYSDIMKYPNLSRHIKENQQRSREGFLSFMQRGVDEGMLRADVKYDMIPYMFDALGQYIVSQQLQGRYSVEELFSNYFIIALRGLCTEKGMKFIDESLSKG